MAFQVARNGTVDGTTNNVTTLLYFAVPSTVGLLAPNRAHDFLDTIGVNGQVQSSIPVYINSPSATLADAQYIGATKWRDGLQTATGQMAVYNALAAAGFQFSFVPYNAGAANTNTTPAAQVALADTIQNSTHAIKYLEGWNEPSNFGVNGGGHGGSWTAVATFQRDYRTAIKADSALSGVLVTTTSQTEAETPNCGLQFLTIPAGAGCTFADGTVFADVYNIHIYPYFNQAVGMVDPSNGVFQGIHDQFDTQLTHDFVSTNSNGYTGLPLATVKTYPRVVTEMGLSTAQVDARTKAVNAANAYLNAYLDGFSAAFWYELYDEGDGYGLFSGSGAPTQAATYLHNFTSFLADTGSTAATFTPANLDVTISGLPTTGVYKLFQKSTGHYALVLTRNETNYNLSSHAPITISPVDVTVTLGSSANMQVFDTVSGTAAIRSVTGTQITVSVTDYPIVIDILKSVVPATRNVYYEDTSFKWFQHTAAAWVAIAHDPRQSESVQGTQVTDTTGVIYDQPVTPWTLVRSPTLGLQVTHNAVVDTTTANVALLLYWNHTVYFQTSAGGWSYWSGSAWTATTDPRLGQTAVPGIVQGFATSPGSTSIAVSFSPPSTGGAIDAGGYTVQYRVNGTTPWSSVFIPVVTPGKGSFTSGGHTWTVTPGGQVATDGTTDSRTSGVVILLNTPVGNVWQQNNQGNWYSTTLPGSTWSGGTTTSPLTSDITISGLAANTTYDIQVYASNSVGNGNPTGIIATKTSTPSAGFHVANGQVVDSNGNNFVAKGLAILDGEMHDHPASELVRLFPRISAVNLAVGGDNNGALSARSDSEIFAWVDDALSRGLIVVLSDYVPGQPNARTGNDLTNVCNWYSRFASRYKDQPRIWWTTSNEVSGSMSESHRAIYNAIRSTGNNSIIWMESQDGNNTTSGMNAGDYSSMSNVGFNGHTYPWMFDKNSGNQADYDNTATGIVQMFQNFARSADGVMPVMMGEGGNSTGGNGTPPDDRIINGVWACVQAYLNRTGTGTGMFRCYLAWMSDWYGQQTQGDPDTLINTHTNPWTRTSPFGDQVNNDMNR